MIAVPTVIVHVTLETTSPSAAVASLGCVGDGDGDGEADWLPVGDGLPADGVAPAEVDAAGAPVGDAVPAGAVADADGAAEGPVDGALALGVGLGLPDEGMQRMSRMQVWLGVGCPACAAADAWPPPNPMSAAVTSSGTTTRAASLLTTAPPRPRRMR
jgi:hypothetical protein